jgi:hypothetical protein
MSALNGVPATQARSTREFLNLSVRSPIDGHEYLQCVELRDTARHEREFPQFLELVIHSPNLRSTNHPGKASWAAPMEKAVSKGG